jgi:hypothetical protein
MTRLFLSMKYTELGAEDCILRNAVIRVCTQYCYGSKIKDLAVSRYVAWIRDKMNSY